MQHQAPPRIRAFAQELRRNMTDSERRLWAGLRAEQLGFKFRRQHPLGCYIPDFVCLNPKLIIELDGDQHRDAQPYDKQRDAFFRAQGFEVLRFPSNAPLMALGGVLQAIFNHITALAVPAAPIPIFPQRGKGQQPIHNSLTYHHETNH